VRTHWTYRAGRSIFLGLCLLVGPTVAAQPTTGPATAPATAPAAAGRAREVVRRLREAVEQIDLSENQKAQTQKVIDEMQRRLRAMAREAQGDAEQLRVKGREIFNEARLELIEILSPQQQEKLRDLLADAISPPRIDPRMEPRMEPGMDPPPRKQMDEQSDEPTRRPQRNDREDQRSAVPALHHLVNAPAPDFTLTKLDGRAVQLSSFRGKIVVLLFGNYSSPTFRDRADDYEQLRKQFANRAEFLIIYTRESHPTGGWEVERNKEAKVSVEQPKDESERKQLAQQARQTLKLTIPIAPDTMDDKTATAYDAFTTCAVIIGRDGTILAHRKWADRYTLARLIEEAIGG
jgi:hypothetical protein